MLHEKLKSKWWRLTHLYKIKDKNGELVKFKPNYTQLKYRIESAQYKYRYIVKPRQLGFTTDAVIDMLDDACFVPGSSSAITAHERDAVSKIFQIAKRAFDNMPAEFRPKVQYDTRNEYKFLTRYDGVPLDNEFYVALKIRGTTIQRLHVSEAAYIEDREELKMGAKQAVPIGGTITEETTGNGMTEFYDDVMIAWEKQQNGTAGPMDYHVFFYPWFSNPEYSLPGTLPEPDVAKYGDEGDLRNKYKLTDGQLLWRRWKLDEFRTPNTSGVTLNVFQRFKQEYPATLSEAFQSSGGSVFDLELVDSTVTPPALTLDQCYTELSKVYEGNDEKIRAMCEQIKALYLEGFRCWSVPKPGKNYVIGVDPAGDEGQDNAGLALWDGDTVDIEQSIEKFGEVSKKVRPDKLGELAVDIGKLNNNAYIGIENNLLTTVITVSNLKYRNLYTYVEIDKKTEVRTVRLGWNTNTKTREVMIDEYIKLWEEGSLKINSTTTKNEMRTFITDENGKRQHGKNKHDDMLFADFIALQMRKYNKSTTRVFEKNTLT